MSEGYWTQASSLSFHVFTAFFSAVLGDINYQHSHLHAISDGISTWIPGLTYNSHRSNLQKTYCLSTAFFCVLLFFWQVGGWSCGLHCTNRNCSSFAQAFFLSFANRSPGKVSARKREEHCRDGRRFFAEHARSSPLFSFLSQFWVMGVDGNFRRRSCLSYLIPGEAIRKGNSEDTTGE